MYRCNWKRLMLSVIPNVYRLNGPSFMIIILFSDCLVLLNLELHIELTYCATLVRYSAILGA